MMKGRSYSRPFKAMGWHTVFSKIRSSNKQVCTFVTLLDLAANFFG